MVVSRFPDGEFGQYFRSSAICACGVSLLVLWLLSSAARARAVKGFVGKRQARTP